ncbi:hypothetical protein PS2_011695 [Malus domestica]
MKLDMAKTYDRVEWSFLLAMMGALGFPPKYCQRIEECITTVTYSVLINGASTGFIQTQRGLRQGNPMSPFLFLIYAEGFSALVRLREERGALQGVRVVPSGLSVSHLFFANDVVVFCQAEETEQRRKKIALCTNIKGQDDFGSSKKVVFEGVRDVRVSLTREALEGRINGWAEQFMSLSGKDVLIKVVAMTLPNYAMSCFKLPMSLCKELESALAKFWWRGNKDRGGMHWISWKKMKRQKRYGGLDFRDLLAFNIAYLAKNGWRLLHNPDTLLGKILKEKYFPDRSFMEATLGRRSSWGWKGII